MRPIIVFSTATLFYCAAMAVASQLDKLKLHGVPHKAAAAASLAVQKGKGRASKLLFDEGHKKKLPAPLKVKEDPPHDPDRRLMQKGSIRGGKMEDSTQRKRFPRDWNTAFEANVAMPVRLQSTMTKISGHSNRRLQTVEVECFEQDSGLLACVAEDFPGEGLATVLIDCPTDATIVADCQSCSIVVTADNTPTEIDLANDPQCQSCSLCYDTVAYDCSNLAEGDCVMQDCNGICTPSDGEGGGGGGGGDEQCVDVQGWYDSDGDGCDFYAMAPDFCELIGSCCENDGYTANEACCVCGGGIIGGEGGGGDGGGDGGGGGDEQCVDVQGWHDSDGGGCDFYAMAPNFCELIGSCCENDGYTANEACCVCGGGIIGGEGGGGGDGGGGGENGVVYGLQPSCNTDDDDKYNMCLDLVSLSGSYESWMEAFAKATQRWEGIIVGDLPSFSSSELYQGSDVTGTGYPSTIDDVYIYASEASIDGEGSILGQAGPWEWRGTGVVNPRTGEEYQVARAGIMEFDSADIAAMQADGTFDEVVFHEMGHVIGLGCLWEFNGLYIEGSGEYASGTYADDEWKTIGCSGPLPVELHGGDGTADGHWDEDCLGNEILTGYSEDPNDSMPLSRITIATFQDLGYNVDYSQADPFTIADLGVCGSFCPEAGRRLRRNDRKLKAELSSEDRDVVMRHAKTKLTKLHEEFEIAAFARGDRDDGIMAAAELFVLFQDAEGRVHTVHVTWDEVKDLEI